MRLGGERESDNVEDRRGDGGGFSPGAGHVGLGTLAIALVAWYFGIDPRMVLDNAPPSPPPAAVQHAPAPANDPELHFVKQVLAETEDTWGQLFQAEGKHYADPKLVLYTGSTRTACGQGQAAMGPFYCPADRTVYLDLGFYRELRDRFRAPGDFAEAYVIAHEIGHHVQNLLGITTKVDQRMQAVGKAEANRLSVKLELQADCLAGVWAANADKSRHIMEAGDVEQAITAATVIGDDRLQQESRGYVVPDSFTHGTSAQRVRWFKKGMESGRPAACNTFRAASL